VTLAEVAERMKATANEMGFCEASIITLAVASHFKADPDFTLRARIEALAREWENDSKVDHLVARRLREALRGP